MSKSAPTTPPRLWHRRDIVEINSKVRFVMIPSVHYINKPPYPEEKQPGEYDELNQKNSPTPAQEDINQNLASSDLEESYSDQEEVTVLLLPHASEFPDSNISDDEHKESSDERSESDSYSYEGESEGDEGDEYSESESEDEYQEPKRLKPTKSEPPLFPDYTALTVKYEASLKQAAAQSSPAPAVGEPVDKPKELAQLGKRKQRALEPEYDIVEKHQPKHYKPTKKIPAIFPDYTALTRDYEASLKANEAQSSPVLAAPALGNEQEHYVYLGKRSRDEFEESQNLKLSAQAKNNILKAFNENESDPGYYRDGGVARYWWDNEPDEEDLCKPFSAAAITDAIKPSFVKPNLDTSMSDEFVKSSGEVAHPHHDSDFS